jgi:hypothetical protein
MTKNQMTVIRKIVNKDTVNVLVVEIVKGTNLCHFFYKNQNNSQGTAFQFADNVDLEELEKHVCIALANLQELYDFTIERK